MKAHSLAAILFAVACASLPAMARAGDAPPYPVTAPDAAFYPPPSAPPHEPAAGRSAPDRAKTAAEPETEAGYGAPRLIPRRDADRLIDLDAEYRVQMQSIKPLSINSEIAEELSLTQQRLRVDLTLSPGAGIALKSQLDVLDGVLWGDNGQWNGPVRPTTGLDFGSKQPNNAGWTVALIPDGDPTQVSDYGVGLQPVEPLRVNRLYGEVKLPIGLLRIGRQPLAERAGMAANPGDGRANRWGVNYYSETADRILYATKPIEIARALAAHDPAAADASQDRGFFTAFFYDAVANDAPQLSDDNLTGLGLALLARGREADWFGWQWSHLEASLGAAYRHNEQFRTDFWALPLTLTFTAGPVSFDGEVSAAFGHSREIAAGIALLTSKEHLAAGDTQTMRAFGARAVTDYQPAPWFMFTCEFDYASGDDDPSVFSDMTAFYFARDTNVGLLLFEHILAFQSARAAQVGVAHLISHDTPSFPVTEVATDGRLTNAIVLFPYLSFWPHATLLLRFGTLFAMADKPSIDPVLTSINRDGNTIADDVVNFFGGTPGDYYGTEFDFKVEWTYRRFFIWTIETALLVPGDALHDVHGDATPSWLAENRFTFVF